MTALLHGNHSALGTFPKASKVQESTALLYMLLKTTLRLLPSPNIWLFKAIVTFVSWNMQLKPWQYLIPLGLHSIPSKMFIGAAEILSDVHLALLIIEKNNLFPSKLSSALISLGLKQKFIIACANMILSSVAKVKWEIYPCSVRHTWLCFKYKDKAHLEAFLNYS